MRTLVLIAIGGSLLYFTWSRLDEGGAPAEPPAVEESATESGQFMSLQARAEAAKALAEASAAPTEPQASPVEETPGPQETAPSGNQEFPDLAALGDPLVEGELMAHRVMDLQSYLSGDGAKLSSSRKNLLISYGLLIRSMPQQVDKYAKGLSEASDVTSEELELLNSARQGRSVGTRNASHKLHPSPLVMGVSMGLMAEEGDRLLREQQWKAAAGVFSELLLAEVDAPWPTSREALAAWSAQLASAQANYRWNKEGAWPSREMEVEPGDSLVEIRKRALAADPNLTLCTGLIHRMNQLGKYIQAGQVLKIPTDRVQILVDLSARWLFYLHGAEVVGAWPVAIGRQGEETTPGSYLVGEKTPEPTWFPQGRIVPYGDPENPLGTRWITLENSQSLGIHGTWEPETVGQMASDGCVRMRNEDVEELFEILPRGSRVTVRP
jgi:hypothetical protein